MQKIVDFFVGAWNWFNGSKAKIGAVLLSIAALVPEGVLVLGYDLKVILMWAGGLFAGVGVGHIIVKANTKPGATA